jgi:hypothetical protein
MKAIHDRHVAIHEDQFVVTSFSAAVARPLVESFLLPLEDGVKSKLPVNGGVAFKTLISRVSFDNGKDSSYIEDVIVYDEYLGTA